MLLQWAKYISIAVFLMTIILLSSFSHQANAAGERLGGMNLSGYCVSLGQGDSVLNGSTWVCTIGTAITMTSACQWQYPVQNAVALQDSPGNPYSWTCYNGSVSSATPTPTRAVAPTPTQSATPTSPPPVTGARLGGMNLYGYCGSLGQGSSELNGNTWVCATGVTINMNTACQWQYTPNATAKQDTTNNPYSWSCYADGGVVTPTPTEMVTTPTPTQAPTSSTYLATGDSFAFGYHLAQYQQEMLQNTYNPASFQDGYDADFYKQLLGVISGITEINYSCPGETTTSFINGGCAFHTSPSSLHNSYLVGQSQLQVAVAYLQANAGKVSVITLDLGVNDAIALANICQAQANPVTCYNQRTAGVLATVRQNYATILDAVRQAAPQARIILIKAPNPVYYDGTDGLDNGLNQIIDDAAASRNLQVANAYDIFTAGNVCSWTNYCSNPSDFHPNAVGYSQIAAQVWTASGY